MNRRVFLRSLFKGGSALGAAAAFDLSRGSRFAPFERIRGADRGDFPGQRTPGSAIPGSGPARLVSEPIRLDATLQASAFAVSSGEDARYHALVHEEGGAAAKSLLVTPVSDADIARRLREAGLGDGGGVPMLAWTLRDVPLVPWPDARVRGTPMRISVEWEGWDRPRELGDLLRDPGGEGVSFRFGGNEEHDSTWPSGCIACLYSCPGGVISNERYTIRDKVRDRTRFSPVEGLPPDGTPVSVVLEAD